MARCPSQNCAVVLNHLLKHSQCFNPGFSTCVARTYARCRASGRVDSGHAARVNLSSALRVQDGAAPVAPFCGDRQTSLRTQRRPPAAHPRFIQNSPGQGTASPAPLTGDWGRGRFEGMQSI